MVKPQQRHISYISEFTTDIQYRSKAKKILWLIPCPRVVIDSIQLGIDYSAMAASQNVDREVQSYRSALSGLVLQDIPFGEQGATLLCDTSTGHARPVVPVS